MVVVVAGDVNLPKSHLLLEQDDEYSCKDDVEKDIMLVRLSEVG